MRLAEVKTARCKNVAQLLFEAGIFGQGCDLAHRAHRRHRNGIVEGWPDLNQDLPRGPASDPGRVEGKIVAVDLADVVADRKRDEEGVVTRLSFRSWS